MAAVHRVGQVLPGFWLRQVVLGGFHGVETDGGHPGIHADPLRWVLAVTEQRLELVDILRRVALQHAVFLQQHQAGGRQAPDRVSLRVGLLGQQAGSDHPSGVAHPVDLHVRMILVEACGVLAHVFRFESGVNGQLAGGQGREREGGHGNGEQGTQRLERFHENLLSGRARRLAGEVAIRPVCGRCCWLPGAQMLGSAGCGFVTASGQMA